MRIFKYKNLFFLFQNFHITMMATEEASAEHIARAKTPGEVQGIYVFSILAFL